MKKIFSNILIFSLFLSILNINPANSAQFVKIKLKQSGADMIVSWKYSGVKKVSNQVLKIINKDEQFEKLYKPNKSSRSFRVSGLKLNTKYIAEISMLDNNISAKKSFFIYDKPASPYNLSLVWDKSNLLMNWDYNGPKVTEWLISATGTDGKEYLSISTNSPLNTYKLSGLSSKMGYTIILRGSNPAGIGKFTNATSTKSAPSLAKNLKVQPISEDGRAISLSWEYTGPTVTKWLIGIRAPGYARDLETLSIAGKDRTLEIRGLSESGNYRFILVGVNEYGNAAEVSSSYTTNAPIKAPTNLKATSQHQSVKLNWTSPFSDKGPITGYRVEYAPLNTNNWVTVSSSNSDNSLIISNLKNGDQYKFRVSALSGTAISLLSSEVTALAGVIPEAPTSLTAKPGDQKIDLSWVPPKGNIISYLVEYKLATDTIWTRLSVTTTNTATIPDLTGGKSYIVRVAAEGESGISPFTKSVTAIVMGTPAAPVLSIQTGNRQVTLSWSTPASNGSPITGFRISQRIGDGVTKTVNDSPITTNKTTLTDLTPGETYHFQVAAQNIVGEGALSNSVSANISIAPDAPQLTATALPNGANLSWTQPNNNGSTITAYKLERAGGGSTWKTLSETLLSTSYKDSNLINGTNYQYRISARNIQGWSTTSLPVGVTPSSTAIGVTGLTLTPLINSIFVSWTPLSTSSTATGGTAVLGYKVYIKSGNAPFEIAPNGIISAPPPTISTTSSPTSTPPLPTNLTISELIPGQNYDIKVIAYTENGDGADSIFKSISPYSTPPAPTNLSVSALDKSVKLTWNHPATSTTTPPSSLLRYKVERSIDGIDFDEVAKDLTVLSSNITGLNNAESYQFRVYTGYKLGSSIVYGAFISSSGTPSSVPDAPTLTGSAGNKSASLSWDAPSANGSQIISYRLERLSPGSSWRVIADSITTNSYNDTTLTNGVSYSYRISALNSKGYSAPSTSFAIIPVSVPVAVSNLAVAPFINELLVSWSPISSSSLYTGGSPITNYKVYIRTLNGEWSVAPDGVLPATATNHKIYNLNPGVSYEVKVTAITEKGEGADSAIKIGIPYDSPGAPIDLSAVGQDKKVIITWIAPERPLHFPVSSTFRYKVEYTLDGNTWLPISEVTALTAEVTNLTNGFPYKFKVTTGYTITSGVSYGESAIIEATPRGVPNAPAGFKAVRLDSNNIRLEWSPPSYTGGASISSYEIQYSDTGLNWSSPATQPLASENFKIISNLSQSKPWTFRIRALNSLTCTNTAAIEAQTILDNAVTKMNAATPPRFTLIDADFAGVDFDQSTSGIQGAASVKGSDIVGIFWLYRSKDNIEVKIYANQTLDAGFSNNCRSTFVTTQVSSIAVPTQVTGLTTILTGNSTVSLQWNANPSSENITSYKVEYTSDGSNWSILPGNVTTNSVTIGSLINNIRYTFRVSAQNSSGVGLGATIQGTPVGPLPVSNLSATAGDGKVTLSWTLPTSSAFVINNIQIRYSSNSGTTYTTLPLLAGNQTSRIVDSLTNSTNYLFDVILITNLGNSSSVSANATPIGSIPTAVRNIAATPSSSSVLLSWSAPSNSGTSDLRYKVEYKLASESSYSLLTDTHTELSYNVIGLTYNSSYNFRVSAINSSGSGPSTTISATTLAIPPSEPLSLQLTVISATQINATWSAPSNNGGSNITDYIIEISNNGGANFLVFPDAVSSTTSRNITGLTTATNYIVRIIARNSVGDSIPSETASATTL